MGALLGLFAGSVLSLFSAGLIGIVHLRDQSRRLKAVLVGQLNNLSGHCRASANSLENGKRELIVRLRMAKYGEIASLNEALTKVGHLDAKIIEELIGLSLRVRNNDIELDWAIGIVTSAKELTDWKKQIDIQGLIRRLNKVSKSSKDLAKALDEAKLPLWWPISSRAASAEVYSHRADLIAQEMENDLR